MSLYGNDLLTPQTYIHWTCTLFSGCFYPTAIKGFDLAAVTLSLEMLSRVDLSNRKV